MNNTLNNLINQIKTDTSGKWVSIDEVKLLVDAIVRQCAGVTLDYKNDEHYKGWCDHSEEILKHFGVN